MAPLNECYWEPITSVTRVQRGNVNGEEKRPERDEERAQGSRLACDEITSPGPDENSVSIQTN